jgi:hypothetical protein
VGNRRIFFLAIALAFLLAGVVLRLVFYGRDPNNAVTIRGGLKPQEVIQIERDYCRLRWANFHKAVAAHNLPFVLSCIRELAFGRIREIGSPSAGCAVVYTGYVWNSRVDWVCDLTLTTNGWTLP